jgi:hypothetical protein
MTDAESKLILELRRVSASHRVSGERRTADLLLRAADKIERQERKIAGLENPPCKHERSSGWASADGSYRSTCDVCGKVLADVRAAGAGEATP